MCTYRTLLAAIGLMAMAIAAEAELIDRGGGMIYDSTLDVTWLQNANFGAGSIFDDGDSDSDGLMTWASATAWADQLVHGGFSDWRLPTMDVNGDSTVEDCGLVTQETCLDNELGYMYWYNLDGATVMNATGDQGPFTNIQNFHWSSTDFESPFFDLAYGLVFFNGTQGGFDELTAAAAAWAVRDGDVGVIPLPAGIWLLGSALAGLSLARRRPIRAR